MAGWTTAATGEEHHGSSLTAAGCDCACCFADRDARVSLSPLSPTQQLTMSFSMRICLMMSLPFSAADSPSPDCHTHSNSQQPTAVSNSPCSHFRLMTTPHAAMSFDTTTIRFIRLGWEELQHQRRLPRGTPTPSVDNGGVV